MAVVDIDVHFGNGTCEVLRHDPDAFFGSVHLATCAAAFQPPGLGSAGVAGAKSPSGTKENPCAHVVCIHRDKGEPWEGFFPIGLGLDEWNAAQAVHNVLFGK